MLIENEIIQNIGNKDKIIELSKESNGIPSRECLIYALKLIKETKNIEDIKITPAQDVKEALEKALKKYRLKDWKVDFSDKKLTTVYIAEKKITVCKDRKFSAKDPKRLTVHEIGTHILRAENGYNQPFKIFALGLKGYLETEEGLANYFEEITGNKSNEIFRDYAGRVIAVDCVYKNLDFRECFDKLINLDFGQEQAWNLSLRAYRGGGYIKDHVYLEGYLKVKEFFKGNQKLDNVYIGKIGIKDLPLIERLLEEKKIKPAKYLPNFI